MASGRRTAAVIRVLRSATLMLLLSGLLAGCGAPPTEDLVRSVEQTRAAVRTVELALDQLGRDRTTAAVAEVAAANAADEIAQAQQQAGDVHAPSATDRALFGAAMTPYEVFFFSSGAVEEGWTTNDLAQSRLNVLVGFPFGGLLSLAIAGCAALVLLPRTIEVTSLSQVVLPVAEAGGTLLLAVIILGVLAATFGAALETTLAAAYTLAQFNGWSWGKFRRPSQAARFHLTMIICLVVGLGVLLTGIDPVQITELSAVFSAIALPLTYLPILIVANDPEYMGEQVNGAVLNGVGVAYLVVIAVASVAAIPLLVITGAGS